MLYESALSFSEAGNRFDKSFIRHFFQQSGASGRLQGKNFLNIRPSEDRLKPDFFEQFANMGGCFGGERLLNVHFFTFNVRFFILNVHFFRSFKRSVDSQSSVMKRVFPVQQKVLQEQFQKLRRFMDTVL